MSLPSYPTRLRDQLGNEVRVPPRPFAEGGEGAVFDVEGRPDLVAKLYNTPPGPERRDKLRAMVKLCHPDLLKIAAWPTATLAAGDPSEVDGILMPRVADHVEIHRLYSVAQRKQEFPEADWGFLLHTARNCAIAFEAIHARGHVVGDVNQKNVLVSRKGIVAFVDCDSFQVAEGSRVFRCGVGVPEFTPPELHGKDFGGVDRAPNHDLFGLAVLIFHLAMMGRHPFSGVPSGDVDLPIEKAIPGGDFAYARGAIGSRLGPPPGVPPTTMLDPSLLDLFERAFVTPTRPSAAEWRSALDSAMRRLVRCKADTRHAYIATAGRCPWCEMIAAAKLMFFAPGPALAPTFEPEAVQRLLSRLSGLRLVLVPYTRPSPQATIRFPLPAGIHAPTRKPSMLPPPPVPIDPPMPEVIAPAIPPPIDPPRPALLPQPSRPIYPPEPEVDPPSPLIPILCAAGMGGGCGAFFILPLLGIVLFSLFAAWLAIWMILRPEWREKARLALLERYDEECDRIDLDHERLRKAVEGENERRMAGWRAIKAEREAEYQRASREAEEQTRQQRALWEKSKAARAADYARDSEAVAAANRRLVQEWEADNRTWLDEERRWRDRLDRAESELKRLEAEISDHRPAVRARFDARRTEVDRIVARYQAEKRGYDEEIRRAEADSRAVQLDEHLDGALIRHSKIRAMTPGRIMALESSGIQTAKDVPMLRTRKVQDIGMVMTYRLNSWRNGIVKSFVPRSTLPDSERRRIAARFAPALVPLADEIEAATRDLEGIIERDKARERDLTKAIGEAVQEIAVAEAHLRALDELR